MQRMKIISWLEGRGSAADCCIYEASMQHTPEGVVCMVRGEDADYLLAPAAIGFAGDPFTANDRKWTLAPLTAENAAKLRSIFPFTAPRAVLHEKRTVGVGDRLGIAAPGHIRAFEKYDAYPVLAQQSIRELTLTGRTFEQVLDCASFAVFRCGYTRGFGADGDHLKTAEEVAYAIRCGYTIITLDCSEHICNDAALMTAQQVEEAYCPDPVLEKLYLGRTFLIEGQEIAFEEADFHRMSLIYNEAIDFAVKIYRQFLGGASAPEFEVSIDETVTPTTPAQHYYVAAELIRRGVRPATIAPRFCGEFQKGVDYIGDLSQFQKEFDTHARIAHHFGYKISVHSGSDKFSVFRKVGKYTQGIFHLAVIPFIARLCCIGTLMLFQIQLACIDGISVPFFFQTMEEINRKPLLHRRLPSQIFLALQAF